MQESMKQYMSEGEAIYMDKNFGLFSRRLAEWAISNMETVDATTKEIKRIKPVGLTEFEEVMKTNKVVLQEEFVYTGWYLYNMSIADYPKSLKTDEQRVMFVDETINDPDGSPENVLACFVAKMCVMNVPIHWEKYL